MKTTIELPDALARRARDVSARQRVTLRELVVSGLLAELDRREQPRPRPFALRTMGGEGLARDVAPAEVIAASYES
jgi:hypothetical protein